MLTGWRRWLEAFRAYSANEEPRLDGEPKPKPPQPWSDDQFTSLYLWDEDATKQQAERVRSLARCAGMTAEILAGCAGRKSVSVDDAQAGFTVACQSIGMLPLPESYSEKVKANPC